MKFLDKTITSIDSNFKKLSTKEEKRDYLTILGHKHLSLWLTYKFMNSSIPVCISFFICVVNLVLLTTVQAEISRTVFYLTMPFPTICAIIMATIRYKTVRKKQDINEVGNWLCDKFQNLWLWNGHVISLSNWLYIKKTNKKLYNQLRSDYCNHHCYDATLQLARALNNPDIKVLWISICHLGEKYGHAVLEKNGKIYDSNNRKTYKKEKYFKAEKAEIFKEIPINIYQTASNFSMLGWKEFGIWCQERGVIRNT